MGFAGSAGSTNLGAISPRHTISPRFRGVFVFGGCPPCYCDNIAIAWSPPTNIAAIVHTNIAPIAHRPMVVNILIIFPL